MSNKVLFTREGHTVTIVFNSKIAQAMAELHGSAFLAVTISPDTILVSADCISGYALAHEWGHLLHRLELGGVWLLHVLRGYVIDGYKNSPAEKRADSYRDGQWTTFPPSICATT